MDQTQPFAGIEVVEFGQFIAVPFCAQVLAEGGAHVIKVEALEGDPVRQLAQLAPGETRHFVSRNRGKHALPLDLRHPKAARVIERLLGRADVVLTNFRPGLAEEFGLDGASLEARYPRLVVGNVSAFGRRGPDARLAGMDLVVQARTGLLAGLGKVQDGLPASDDAPVADYMCAMTLAELRAAGRSFEEQVALSPQVRTPGMVNVYFRTYATKDGVRGVACVSPGLQRAFMKAVGLGDEVHEKAIADRDAVARHYGALRPRVEAVLAGRTTDEWRKIFDAHGLPASDVRLAFELLDDAQALANGLLHDLPHPALGPVRVLAPPLTLDGPGFRPGAATRSLGAETRPILGELGFSAEEIAALLADRVTRALPG